MGKKWKLSFPLPEDIYLFCIYLNTAIFKKNFQMYIYFTKVFHNIRQHPNFSFLVLFLAQVHKWLSFSWLVRPCFDDQLIQFLSLWFWTHIECLIFVLFLWMHHSEHWMKDSWHTNSDTFPLFESKYSVILMSRISFNNY